MSSIPHCLYAAAENTSEFQNYAWHQTNASDMISSIMKKIHRAFFSRNRDVCHGQLVFRDTRIPVSLVLQMFEGGESMEQILRGYPSLTRKAIQAALHVASETVENAR